MDVAWHIGGRYRTFTALVGLDATDTRPATLSFVGPTGKPETFRADGHPVQRTILISGLPTAVTMNIVGMLNFVVETTTAGATIDFGDDTLQP
jgi:hypothetical protein